jgi:hypothetical protein
VRLADTLWPAARGPLWGPLPAATGQPPADTLQELDLHRARFLPSYSQMDYVACLPEGTFVVPIEFKRPATIGLWRGNVEAYRARADPAARGRRLQLQLEQQQVQRDFAHAVVDGVLPTEGRRTVGDVQTQADTYAALWQTLTQMLRCRTPYGVLTDAILFVFLHLQWSGDNVHVEYIVRHRMDTTPTVIQCLAAVFNLAAADAAAPAARSWPKALTELLAAPLDNPDYPAAHGADPAADGCALVC